MNLIELKPVGKIILNEKTPDRELRFEHYLIPYYQRGYRWDVEHVSALLDDIHNFMQTDEKKYCLQPIVVVPAIDKNGFNIWEVIDGQQRLITMNIIFNYLKRPRYTIIFEKRGKSTEFLENLSPATYNDKSPDFHYMSQAYRVVKEWFEDKTKNDVGYIDEFNSTLTKRVEIIWYQIEELKGVEDLDEVESKKIDIFNRLNIGKIPLTDAELIRALLLSKIKFGLSDREAILRQAEISNDWHRMEMELRNEEFWYFINNKPLDETSSTIEFIFKLIAKDNTKKYSTYLWFEKQIKSESPDVEKANAIKLWNQTKEHFSKLKYWFENDFLYHHLGFILALDDNPVKAIRKIIDNSNCSKTKFKEYAFGEAKAKVSNIDLNHLSYDSGKEDLRKIFLLHNIVTSTTSITSQKNRFPFNLYKGIDNNGGWSIEHIHAQESKQMKDQKAIRKWLEDTFEAIKDIKKIDFESEEPRNQEQDSHELNEEYKTRISDLLSQDRIDEDLFNQLKNDLILLFDSGSVHILDNLALLSAKNNSSLNNSIFPVKRNKILQLEKNGEYIPLTTKNVFLKYYTDSDLQPYYWSKTDKKNYYRDIDEKLKPYLKSDSK
ncbi:DUF262 domain-containing protein [Rufibacter psychrotolerans]|uniref:DUF262 domain-containing protein n=1 Tax=Rufibacter psychrotolerans TaxID=2812556 RepID=UPI0019673AC5|nr:DUF262 domain-containing protein [Rufibacter sp. SYSU D00308]